MRAMNANPANKMTNGCGRHGYHPTTIQVDAIGHSKQWFGLAHRLDVVTATAFITCAFARAGKPNKNKLSKSEQSKLLTVI